VVLISRWPKSGVLLHTLPGPVASMYIFKSGSLNNTISLVFEVSGRTHLREDMKLTPSDNIYEYK